MVYRGGLSSYTHVAVKRVILTLIANRVADVHPELLAGVLLVRAGVVWFIERLYEFGVIARSRSIGLCIGISTSSVELENEISTHMRMHILTQHSCHEHNIRSRVAAENLQTATSLKHLSPLCQTTSVIVNEVRNDESKALLAIAAAAQRVYT